MANPQLEEGYTRIANEIMEALIKIRVPGEAMQVLLMIIRKTFGFNKKEDAISLSQFNIHTGIVKPSIIRAIKQLISMNLIYKKANGKTQSYCFNKDYSTWKPLAKKLTISENANNRLRKSKFSLAKKLPTKESIKRKYQKKESSPSLKKLFNQKNEAYKAAELFFNQILKNNPHSRLHVCQNEDREKTIQRWAKDIDLLIHIDGQEPSIVEEVICWCQQDGFWRANILSGKKLREKWDTLVAQMNRNKGVSTSKDDKRFAFLQNIYGPQKPRDAAGRILQNVTELAVEKDIDTRRPTHDEEIIDPATGNPVKVFK